MKIGVRCGDWENIDENFRQLTKYGIHCCQLCSFDPALYTNEAASKVKAACKKYNVEISTLWTGWSGPAIWNFTEGPLTLGLVPAAYRQKRVQELKQGADFAVKIGVSQIATHVGFLPENPNDPEFDGIMNAIREAAQYCKDRGLRFLFETGQETPVALMRAMEVVGTGNMGINLDTANPILYGKANPVDMLQMLGDCVYDLHIKDGLWPADGWNLGEEVPVGQGEVNFPAIIKKLKELGYDGALTIEREISGDQQIQDIIATKAYLEMLLADAED